MAKKQKRKRNYKREYSQYHSKPQQKKNRAKRNKARRAALRSRTVKKGDNKEIDHTVPLSKGGSAGKSNTRVTSRTANRKKFVGKGKRKKKSTKK